jgi:hypothetical protein
MVGLMLVFMPGLLWDAGPFMAERRAVREIGPGDGPSDRAMGNRWDAGFGLGVAYAAESSQPALVRKKLPELTSATPPRAEPQPASPAPAAPPTTTEPETPKAVAASEPAPPPAAPPPEAVIVPPSPVAPPAPAKIEAPKPEPAPVSAKIETPKPEPAPASATRAAYPFSILLSSCREKENALAALSGYRQTGMTPYIVRTDLGGKGIWWRTLTGHYRTLAEATQAKNALKLPDAVVVKTPYANLIGQYGSETEAAEAANRVAQKEVFAYVVKGPGPLFQLMAGAFPSQNAAEIHRRELDARGVSTRTVQR